MVIFMKGGTGNIGQYVTLELLKRGHKIKLLSRTPDRIKAFSQMENVELIGGTILDKDIIKNENLVYSFIDCFIKQENILFCKTCFYYTFNTKCQYGCT